MWGSNKKIRSSKIETLIGQGIVITGDLKFSGGLHLDGKIIGEVISEDDSNSVLVVSDHGCIEGDVHVSFAVINGMVKGNVYVSQKLELSSHASITGNVHYNLLEMVSGAEVNGNMVHDSKPQKKRLEHQTDSRLDTQTDITETKVRNIDPAASHHR